MQCLWNNPIPKQFQKGKAWQTEKGGRWTSGNWNDSFITPKKQVLFNIRNSQGEACWKCGWSSKSGCINRETARTLVHSFSESYSMVFPAQLRTFPFPRVSSRSSNPTSWILSPSHGFTCPFSNWNSELRPASLIKPLGDICGATGFTRLKVGEVGTAETEGANFWKLIHWPESTVEVSDSSHSGMVAGVWNWRWVGLAGADTT